MSPRSVQLTDRINPDRPAFWAQPDSDRREAFRRLRAMEQPLLVGETSSGRSYALVRHRDVAAASKKPDVFRNAPGATTPPPARWVRALFGASMVNLDGQEHTRLRRVIAGAFTPRILARTETEIRTAADRIVDRIPPDAPAEFVTAVAAPMPFEVLCTMMGIPVTERNRIRELIDQASAHTGIHRPLLQRLRSPGRGLRALAEMHRIIARIGRERRQHPGEDLISRLVAPDRDGNHLTGKELGAFFSLLLVAGVETTRNALAHGLHLLTTHPDQRALLLADLEGHLDTAAEEIVRHSTPIHQFRRTIARHHPGEGHDYAPGDKITLYYASANHDEAVFADPAAFDITRNPNPHLGFGGGGPHYCLGAHLARQEIRAVLHALLTRYPHVHAMASPSVSPTAFDHRVVSLPFTLGPARGMMET